MESSEIANGGRIMMSSQLKELSNFSKVFCCDFFRNLNTMISWLVGEVSNRDGNLSPDFLSGKLNLTKREFNSRIGVLMSYDLVDMVSNQYVFTTLGKDAYESLRIIDRAIKIHEKFDMNNNNSR